MIDIHLHILPGIDDGPATIEGSIATARRATEDGVTVVAATPHLRADHAAVRPHELAGRCEELQRALVEHGLAVTVVPGGEVDLRWATGASDEDLRLVSYAQRGRHLLVETPYGDLDGAFEDRVFGLALRGYTLVLAHPERSPTFQRDPARVGRLVERGTLMQVTAMSLASERRRSRSRRLARALVREGLAHVVASDAHGADEWRAPNLSAGAQAAAAIDPARAAWMVEDAPEAILAGRELPPPPRSERRRRLRRGSWP